MSFWAFAVVVRCTCMTSVRYESLARTCVPKGGGEGWLPLLFSFCKHPIEFRPSSCWCAWAPRPGLYVQDELENLQLHACEACLWAGGDTVGGGNPLLLYILCGGVSSHSSQSPPVSDLGADVICAG